MANGLRRDANKDPLGPLRPVGVDVISPNPLRANKPIAADPLITGEARQGAVVPDTPDFDSQGEVVKGLRRGAFQLKGSLFDAVDLAGSVLDDASLQKVGREGAERNLAEASKRQARISSLADAKTGKDYLDFIAGGVGSVIPYALAAVGGGVASKLLSKVGGLGKTGTKIATTTGAGAPIAAAETGGVSREIEEATGRKAPGTALATGTAIAALDIFSLGRGLRRFKGGGPGTTTEKIARGVAATTVTEGITEGTQEAMAILAVDFEKNGIDNLQPFNSENFQRILDSMAIGAAAGGLGGGVTSTAGALSDRNAVAQTARTQEEADALKFIQENVDAQPQFTTTGRSQEELDIIRRQQRRQGSQGVSFGEEVAEAEFGRRGVTSSLLGGQGLEEEIQGARTEEEEGGSVSEAFRQAEREQDEVEFRQGEGGVEFSSINITDPAETKAAGFISNQRGLPWFTGSEVNQAFSNRQGDEFNQKLSKTFSGNNDAIDRRIQELDSAGEFEHRKITLLEQVQTEAEELFSTTEERNDAVELLAQQMGEEAIAQNQPSSSLFDPNNPADFLSNFSVIERIPFSGAVRSEPLALLDEEIVAKFSPEQRRLRTELNKVLKTAPENVKAKRALADMDRTKASASIINRPTKEGGVRRGEFQVTMNGRTVNVNAHQLTSVMLDKLRKDGAAQPKIEDAFFAGLSSLVSSDRNISIGTLPNETIVFSTNPGKEKGVTTINLTLGELRVQGKERLGTRVTQLKQQLQTLLGVSPASARLSSLRNKFTTTTDVNQRKLIVEQAREERAFIKERMQARQDTIIFTLRTNISSNIKDRLRNEFKARQKDINNIARQEAIESQLDNATQEVRNFFDPDDKINDAIREVNEAIAAGKFPSEEAAIAVATREGKQISEASTPEEKFSDAKDRLATIESKIRDTEDSLITSASPKDRTKFATKIAKLEKQREGVSNSIASLQAKIFEEAGTTDTTLINEKVRLEPIKLDSIGIFIGKEPERGGVRLSEDEKTTLTNDEKDLRDLSEEYADLTDEIQTTGARLNAAAEANNTERVDAELKNLQNARLDRADVTQRMKQATKNISNKNVRTIDTSAAPKEKVEPKIIIPTDVKVETVGEVFKPPAIDTRGMTLKEIEVAIEKINKLEPQLTTGRSKKEIELEAKFTNLIDDLQSAREDNDVEAVERIEEEMDKVAVQLDQLSTGEAPPVPPSIDISEFETRGNDASYRDLQREADRLADNLNIKNKVNVINATQFIEKINKVAPDKAAETIASFLIGAHDGITFQAENGVIDIFISPYIEGNLRTEAFSHEMGHAIRNSTVDTITGKQARAILQDFLDWINTYRDEKILISDVLESKRSPAFAVRGYAGSMSGGIVGDLNESQLEYLFEFEEWFADSIGKWAFEERKVTSTVDKFFRDIFRDIKRMFSFLGLNIQGQGIFSFMDSLLVNGNAQWDSPFDVWSVLQLNKDDLEGDIQGREEVLARIKKYVQNTVGVNVEADESFWIGETPEERLMWTSLMQADLNDVYGPAFNQSIQYAMKHMFSAEEKGTIFSAISSPVVINQLRRLLQQDQVSFESVLNDPMTAAAYAYQYWIGGRLTLEPKSNKLFATMFRWLRDIFGFVTDSEQADQLFRGFSDGRLLLREQANGEFVVHRHLRDTAFQRSVESWNPVFEKVSNAWGTLLSTSDSRLRATNNVFLTKIANLIDNKVGVENQGEGMLSSRSAIIGKFGNQVSKIFKGKSKEFGEEVATVLNNPDAFSSADPDVKIAVKGVRKIFRSMFEYARKKGLDLKDRGPDYFPWVFEPGHMMRNADEFISLLKQEKFSGEINKIAKNLKISPDRVPEHIVQRITTEGGYGDIDFTPKSNFMNFRSLGFVKSLGNAKDREVLSKFFNKDVGVTMISYISQMAKKAEFESRFGNVISTTQTDDLEVTTKLDDLLFEAKESGASEADIELARDYVNASIGLHGYKMNHWLHKKLGLDLPPPGQPIKPRTQAIMGAIIVYQNLRVLAMATLTSLVDPVAIMVRTGDMHIAFQGFKKGIAESFNAARGNESLLVDMGETLGIIDREMTTEALNWEFGGAFVSGRAKKINEMFFKYTGLQSWTRATRIMGLESGLKFITRHVKKPDKNSDRFLRELGITRKDVRFDKDGTILVEAGKDQKVEEALRRFVDSAILRPNVALRPLWASDPHFMLVFHLKSFMFAFHERVLKRVVLEAGQQNYVPLLMLGMFIPAMIGADLLRDLIRDGGTPDRKRNWTVYDYLAEGSRRSGLYGKGQLLQDAQMDRKFGGVGIESFLGPTFQQMSNFPKLFAVDDNVQWNALIKATPGQALFRHWVTPY